MTKEEILDNKTVKDWERTGLLEGILHEDRQELVDIFNKGKDIYSYEKESSEYIIPVIRHIFSNLKYQKNKHLSDHIEFYFLNVHKEVGNILLERFDLKNLIEKFDSCYENVIPLVDSYFKNVDGHSETVMLFCRDYIYGMYSDYKKEKL